MPDPFVVGPTGLPLYRFADWRAVVVQLWRAAYGDDADTRSETPDGLLIDTLATLLTQAGDGVQAVWANSFFRTAAAPGLDLILDLFGRQRLEALPTTLTGVWYGTAATVVHDGVGTGPVASVVSAGETNGDRYAVDEGVAGTIPAVAADGALIVIRVNAVTDGNDYGIEVGAVESVFNAPVSSTVETVADGLATELRNDNPTFAISTPGLDPGGAALIVMEGKGTQNVVVGPSTTDPLELDVFPGIRLAMSAEQTGPQVVIAGTMITIETPAAGLTGVINTLDGDIGRDIETDADYRARHIDQLNFGGKSTPQRIRAALLAPVEDGGLGDDADYVRVIENETSVPLPSGQPGHSFRVIFVGDATDEEVAAIIFDQKPAGIQAWGGINVGVTDEFGAVHNIGFDRGIERFLHLSITIFPGEAFPTTGNPAAAITNAVAVDLAARLQLGTDLLRYELGGPINNAAPGIMDAVIGTDDTPLPTDPPFFNAADISVDVTEILISDSSRITTVIV